MLAANEVPNIGDLLRERRESLKLSLDKISVKTKINANILKQIEKNEFDKLPSPAYTKGFVLSYALTVGIDKAMAIASLEITYQRLLGKPFPSLNHTVNLPNPNAIVRPDDHQTQKKYTATKKAVTHSETGSPQDIIADTEKRKNQTRVFISSGIFVVLFLSILGVYKLVTNAIDNETKIVNDGVKSPTFVPSSDLLKPPAAKDLPGQKEEVIESKKAVVKAPTQESIPLQPAAVTPVVEMKRNFPQVEFRKINKKLFEIVEEAPENSDSKILPDDVKNKMTQGLENIYIRAISGNTWLSYKIDNRPINSVIVEKDKDLFLQGKEILLYLGNVGVTKIFYNNKLISTPTPSGVKSLVFPESIHSKHVFPLFPKASDNVLYSAEDYQKRMKIEDEQIKSQAKTQ
jgi:cytoskeleton protein RodZ